MPVRIRNANCFVCAGRQISAFCILSFSTFTSHPRVSSSLAPGGLNHWSASAFATMSLKVAMVLRSASAASAIFLSPAVS
jgi:hypothetical protein